MHQLFKAYKCFPRSSLGYFPRRHTARRFDTHHHTDVLTHVSVRNFEQQVDVYVEM